MATGEQRLQPRTAFGHRALPDVLSLVLQQVVGHEGRRRPGKDLRGERLAADARLQQREGQRPVLAVGQHLAVEHGALGQRLPGLDHLGEALGDELLAA